MKNVVGLFENMRDAEAVVRDLRAAGINDADISFASRNPDAATMEANTYTAGHSEAAEGAGFGATGGTIVGGLTGLLVGLGALTIPGIGPVVAAGTLATALGSTALGAGIGAATGGLLGALVGAGIPEEDAHIYSEGIRRGGALVMAQVDDNLVDTTLDIMERHNVVDIDERGAHYRSSGWSRFDENAGPYSDTGYADRAVGEDEYDRSSKVGTAGGAVAGAATGAALGSAGGPVGTVVGGAAGAVTGGVVGAAGDAAGTAASEGNTMRGTDYDTTGTGYDRGTETGYTTGGTGYSTTDTGTTGTMTGSTMGGTTDTSYSSTGDADRMPDADDYDRSSKVGTAGGAVAGAATGAAMGSVGGPVGTVVGGVAGAVTGGAVGAAGDAVGAEATDDDTSRATDYTSSSMSGTSGTAYGSATDYGSTESTMGDATRRYRSRSYEVGGTGSSGMESRIEEATERGIDDELDRNRNTGTNY